MNLKNLKHILLALTLGLRTVSATEFDRDYETALSQRSVRNLVDHIQQLSQTVINDNSVTRARKCEALKYFFATGGRNGFRQTSATAEEIRVLTQALSITTILHYDSHATQNTPLDLVQINKQKGRGVDSTVQQHLTFAQSIVSYTLMTYHASSLLQYANNLLAMPQQELSKVAQNTGAVFSNLYKKPLESLLPYATDQVWKTKFIDGITLESQNAILQGLRLTVQSFKNADNFDENEIAAIKSIVSQLFSSNQPSAQSSLRRAPARSSSGSSNIRFTLANGSILQRAVGQYTRLISGSMDIQAGTGIHMGDFNVDTNMTNQELRNALSAVATIISEETF